MSGLGLWCRLFAVGVLVIPCQSAHAARYSNSAREWANADVTGVVTDSATGQPVSGAQVSVANYIGAVVATTTTSTFGAFTVHNLAPGPYSLSVRMIGFRAERMPFIIASAVTAAQVLNVALSRIGLNLQAMQITNAPIVTLDSRTGDQIFRQNTFHSAPAATTSQIIQASIAGAARAPTGEVHIRGQHAEYTFYVDGVPVPAGISGSLNELFDPDVVDHITFQTGGWDAEYGGRIAAVVNITTKIPTGGFQGDASAYGGGYTGSTVAGPTGSNGQSATVSDNRGPWGFFLSGTRQFSDMRLEPVVIDPRTGLISNFHNSGTDLYGFGKLQYTRSTREVFTLEGSLSTTAFEVPFDSTGGAFQNDHQNDANSFLNLGWHRQIGDIDSAGRARSDVFGALFYRHASLRFDPDPNDDPSFQFFPDTTLFNLSENRSANIYGLKLDYAFRPERETEFKIGTLSSVTTGHEDFSAFNAVSLGPQSNVDLNGYDVGFYGQTVYSPVERIELRVGLRYDTHAAPDTPVESQLSPRIRLNFYPSALTTAYLYYGRLFMPTNIEDLRTITSVAQGGQAAQPTVPERDNFYEAGVVQRFPRPGVVAKLAAYHKDSNPGIDDNTIPGSAIVTDVNIAHIRITGIEGVLELNPKGSFSGYVNAALNHAYGFGAITGGFFPTQPPAGAFDLDHDQRVSIVASGTYSPKRLFLSGMIIYGSGLTNGVDPADCHCSFGTGLFDFNSGIHVSPNTIFNAAGGYSFVVRGSVMTPQLYVENLFNKTYLLKGAFFSGPSVGRPRSLQLKLKATF